MQEIRVYRDLMGENDRWAAESRRLLSETRTLMINLIGSPGCGKTTLLEGSVSTSRDELSFAVLEGDVETTRDAERIAALEIPTAQLLTGGSCHLEAKLVNKALGDLDLSDIDIVVVENVGNLVCPAEFDVGEHAKVAVLSVAEGDEKPEKYPLLFKESSIVVITKTDLLPYVDFDMDRCCAAIKAVNPVAPILQLASRTGDGIDQWNDWLKKSVAALK